jgi:hypothetical protein
METEILIVNKLEDSKPENSVSKFFMFGFVDRHSYGIFGECYSQPESFLKSALTEVSIYSDDELFEKDYDHENMSKGQRSLDLLYSTLNSISPDLSIEIPPKDSVADWLLKWDMILKWGSYNFPIQVKSSLVGVGKDIQRSRKFSEKHMDCPSLSVSPYAKLKIRDLNQLRYSMLQDDLEGFFDRQIEYYEHSMPLYIWIDTKNKSNIQVTIHSLIEKFSGAFNLNCDIETSQKKAYEIYQERVSNNSSKNPIDSEKEATREARLERIRRRASERANRPLVQNQSIQDNRTNDKQDLKFVKLNKNTE